MKAADTLAEVALTGLRLLPFPTKTGLITLGTPDRMSPVFVTGNYDLTVRRVKRALRHIDGYLLVANSNGVNVWCASSGGHLTTHQVVTAIKLAGLEDRVTHRELILPQLAATGVEGKEVRRRTGWIVRFGPAEADDIPAYLAADKNKTPALRRVRWGARERLEMAVAWATPMSIVAGLFAFDHRASAVALIWALALAVFFLFDRLSLGERARQALFASTSAVACAVGLSLTGNLGLWPLAGWTAASVVAVLLLTFDYAGSSPTAAAGIFEEKDFTVVLDEDRCKGAWSCVAVCPEAVFDKREDVRKVSIAHQDRCIRCGACLVQCPQDALSFATPDGRSVGPDTIRRFKLNLFGKRAADQGPASTV